MKGPSNKHFTATLQRSSNGLGWTIARLPLDAQAAWGKRGLVPVNGEIASARGGAAYAFRTSLFPDGHGGHYLLVNREMQKHAGVQVGEPARFVLKAADSPRPFGKPHELDRALRQDGSLQRWFEKSLTPSQHRDAARWVATPKSAAARQRRAEQLAERLMMTMEAERELPPMLKLAFARNAKAAAGWKKMTAVQRRSHLMGIFYYRTPEAQARRLAKALEDAAARAERQQG